MWQSLPEFGTGVLYAILVAAATRSPCRSPPGRGRPRLLQAARLGAYGTVALVGLAVLVLAYAFVSHDFRIRTSPTTPTAGCRRRSCFTALWGGQDGSLLWWLFLTSLWSGICVRWLGAPLPRAAAVRHRHADGIILFFCDPDGLRGEPVRDQRRRRAAPTARG